MQNKILRDDEATCYLVEVIARNSQDIPWTISLDGEQVSNKNIRRISIDKFYTMITGENEAFKSLCEVLPKVIDDVIERMKIGEIQNSVFGDLNQISSDIMKSIYLLSFEKYEGFDGLNFS